MRKFFSNKINVVIVVVSIIFLSVCGFFVLKCHHKHTKWTVDINPTCTNVGREICFCTNCNEVIDYREIPVKDHIKGSWIIDKESTCLEKGSKHQICSVCEITLKTEEIPLSNHTEGTWTIEIESTCLEEGRKSCICSVCKITYQYKKIPTKNHKEGDRVIVKEPTCLESGSENLLCLECGTIIKSGKIPKLGHQELVWIIDKIPTCLEKGSKHQVCTVCEMTIKIEEIPLECTNLISLNDITYINLHGFGKYQCNDCGKEIYKDVAGKKLEVADLNLNKDKTVILSCNNFYTAEILVIPESVIGLSDDLYFSHSNIKYVLFNENDFTIILRDTRIQHIYIPKNMDVHLSDLNSLSVVIIENGKDFRYTTCAFQDSNIEKIVIPTSVKYIQGLYFKNTKNLKYVFYMGTAEEWEQITVVSKPEAVYLLDADRYYYSEEQPTTDGLYWHYVDGVITIWE